MPARSSDKPSMIISIVSLACSMVSAIADFLSLFGTHRKFQPWQLKKEKYDEFLNMIKAMEAGYALNKSTSPQLDVTTIITSNYNIGQLHIVIHPPCIHSCGVTGPFGHFSQGL
ncbi:hypothetical protein P167DRAFT_535190, partial [Morchella conica CCBAS932]